MIRGSASSTVRSPGRVLPSLVRRGARALAAGLVETTAGLRFPTNTPTDDGTVEEYSGDLYDGALGAVAALEAAHEMNSRGPWRETAGRASSDRTSTSLNSSHPNISYAVFLLK